VRVLALFFNFSQIFQFKNIIMNIAFIGLGVMGLPMSLNLIKGGHRVRGYTLLEKDMAAFVAGGGIAAKSSAEAVRDAGLIISMLPAGEHVRAAVFDPGGIAGGMPESALYVDMSTIGPLETDRIRGQLAGRGLSMMDAPVGRTSAAARTGTLLIFAGGTPEQIARAEPAFKCMGERTIDCGGAGRGIRMKLVNNFMSISLNALASECMVFADALGVSRPLAIDVMGGTPAGRGHFTTTYPKKVFANDLAPDFALNLAHKDLGLALDAANTLHVPLPLGAAAREIYSMARAKKMGALDWTALLRFYEETANPKG
jgi:4-hydroxybutyrate dehydrogenase/sulfolactaldehyde 3-reductase